MVEQLRPTPNDVPSTKEKPPVPIIKFSNSARKMLEREHILGVLTGKQVKELIHHENIALEIEKFDNKELFLQTPSLHCEVAFRTELVTDRRGMAPFEGELYFEKMNEHFKKNQIKQSLGSVADYAEIFYQGLLEANGYSLITRNETVSAKRGSVEEKDMYGNVFREEGFPVKEKRIIEPARTAIVSASDIFKITDHESLRKDKNLAVYPLFVPQSVSIKR